MAFMHEYLDKQFLTNGQSFGEAQDRLKTASSNVARMVWRARVWQSLVSGRHNPCALQLASSACKGTNKLLPQAINANLHLTRSSTGQASISQLQHNHDAPCLDLAVSAFRPLFPSKPGLLFKIMTLLHYGFQANSSKRLSPIYLSETRYSDNQVPEPSAHNLDTDSISSFTQRRLLRRLSHR